MTDVKASENKDNITLQCETDTRELVLQILLEVMEKEKMSHYVLRSTLASNHNMDKAKRAFVSKVSLGTIENLIYIDSIINSVSKVKVKKMKPVIRNLLRMSVYQLLYLENVPDSAVCNEAVKLAAKHKFHNLKGFVNGVLRNIARGKDDFEKPDVGTLEGISLYNSIPVWILEKWNQSYSIDEIQHMCQHFRQEPPLTVRVNQSKASMKEVEASLQSQNIVYESHPFLAGVYKLTGIDRLDMVEAFEKGWIQVQDASSILCGYAMGLKKDDYLLDLCSAPGGKAIHGADLLMGTGKVWARDLTPYKVKMIQDNAKRCHMDNMEISCQDALVFWGEEQEKYDVVLADLPCSGLGIIGRKKDIKYRMTQQQQEELVLLQREILKNAWRYVKPGGHLIYSTCTVNSQENQDNVGWIQENTPLQLESLQPFMPREVWEEYPECERGYVQFVPGKLEMDGFFISRFVRNEFA